MACGFSSTPSYLPIQEVGPHVFGILDSYHCRGTSDILSAEEEKKIDGDPLVIYDRLGPKVLDYMEYCHTLKTLREVVPQIIAEKGISNPNLVTAIALVKKGVGLCGEQSTFAVGKITTVFDGAIGQLVIGNPIKPSENHAFCLISTHPKELMEGMKLLQFRQRQRGEFDLLNLKELKNAYFIDPLFREATACSEIESASKALHYLKEHRATKIMAMKFVPTELRELFAASESSTDEVLESLKTLEIEPSDALEVMRKIHVQATLEDENKTALQTRFADLTWKSSGRMLRASGTADALERLERETRGVFEVFRGVFKGSEPFALVCAMP